MKTFEQILLEQRDKLHPLDDPCVDLERGIYDGNFAPCMEAIKIYSEQVAKDAFEAGKDSNTAGWGGPSYDNYEKYREANPLP